MLERIALLALFNEILLLGVGCLLDRRGVRDPRLHALALGAAALAALTPELADLGTLPAVAQLPAPLRIAAAIACGALSQCGLWAQTFLVTGLLLDALRRQRPTAAFSPQHWFSGLHKGAIYGGLFVALVQLTAEWLGTPALVQLMRSQPALVGALGGAALFPLAKTLVESFDGGRSFFLRLADALREPLNYLRGAIAGLGLALALDAALWRLDGGSRFACGFVIGAAAYAGADWLRDCADVLRRRRLRLQTPRLYALGALLGGFVGGSLAWYFDAGQVASVSAKFWRYAAIHFPAAGMEVAPYVIYPLFSKWGAMDLGATGGGLRLLYNESLSGVINWSLAAPLFSINLTMLNALFRKSLAPVRELVSAAGVALLVEQAVRVLRWGLWMAPIIYSFLRLSPEPSWYNQDGAVRSIVATVQSLLLSPSDFQFWSLQVFLGLLAYDGLRILIWFDHMGLRVATLVNLSFVGGDAVDERAARWIGHAARTRCIPEGIRRFFTWAPLLIPFYLPRGADWDYVWTGAEATHAAAGLLPEVAVLMIGYRAAGIAAAVLLVWLAVALWRKRRAGPAKSAALTIGNGLIFHELHADGQGYSRVLSTLRKGDALDLTRRPDPALPLRGKFFYLCEPEGDGRPWMLGAEDGALSRLSPTALGIRCNRNGIHAETRVEVAVDEPVETWRIRLANPGPRPRRLQLTSYQEPVLSPADAYLRSPPFAALHLGTWFLPALNAIVYRNRLLRDDCNEPKRRRMSPELGFHAVRTPAGVRLLGYEDSRARFVGRGSLHAPDALDGAPLRAPDDAGLLYSFDPAASLRVEVELPASGSVEILFVDGYAENEDLAVQRLARHLGIPLPDPAQLDAQWQRERKLHTPDAALDFEFSADGTELRLRFGGEAPPMPVRPWAHIYSNALGHGAVLGHDGEIFSFAANSQQNSLTPCNLDSIASQMPAQAIYVLPLDGNARVPGTAAFIPCRDADAAHEVVFGTGYAIFRRHSDDLELELTAFVLPDAPLELRLLRLRNRGAQPRRLRVMPYAQIALAEIPADSRGRLEVREADGMLLFRNPANNFRGGWAFAATSLAPVVCETVRARVLGRHNDPARPWLLMTGQRDTAAGDDGDRVAAFAGEIEIPAGGEACVTLLLGQAASLDEIRGLVARYRAADSAERAFRDTRAWWTEKLSQLRVDCGDAALDRLVNTWLPYQVLVSRLWGRTGASQRGGAFGFRDQLQDMLPLLRLWPALARQQILLHASQQFRDGDVLKWWHPARDGRTGIGVRTAASDPQLWLPYVVSHYVAATGDHGLLDERVPFLEGPALPRRTEGLLITPRTSRDDGSLYEHCRRAIGWTLARRGRNGLPLLGSGDWNDGFDVAGLLGRGESVWLGFFLYDVLNRFAPLARRCEGEAAAQRCLQSAQALREVLRRFRRDDRYVIATDDDGVELTGDNALLAAWPALSGAVTPDEGFATILAGLRALEREDRVLLLQPPYTGHSRPYPGRIADYPPGVRENGGQYSHGVSWLVDGLLNCAARFEAEDRADAARDCRQRALALWRKISPLARSAEQQAFYGLPPHQQPADIYDGPAHGGRGGWSWYTGAAARMLSGAYDLLGVQQTFGPQPPALEARIVRSANSRQDPTD